MKTHPFARIGYAVAALLLVTGPAAAQQLRGTILDSVSGQPLAGVRVVVLDVSGTRKGSTLSGSDGRFSVHLPAIRAYRVRASRLGYADRITDPIELDATGEATVLLWLTPRPVPLDTIHVVAKRNRAATEKRVPFLVDAGFYDRQRKGWGYFLTRSDIEQREHLHLTDLLRGKMRGGRLFIWRACKPSVVLDGVLLMAGGMGNRGDLSLDKTLNLFNVEALEIYPGPAGVPVQWGGYLCPCGAVIAWSRR